MERRFNLTQKICLIPQSRVTPEFRLCGSKLYVTSSSYLIITFQYTEEGHFKNEDPLPFWFRSIKNSRSKAYRGIAQLVERRSPKPRVIFPAIFILKFLKKYIVIYISLEGMKKPGLCIKKPKLLKVRSPDFNSLLAHIFSFLFLPFCYRRFKFCDVLSPIKQSWLLKKQMHKFLYKFFTGYGFAFFVMVVIGINVLFTIVAQTNISGAIISSAVAENTAGQEYKNCAQKNSVLEKLSCIEPVGHLSWAYLYFEPIKDRPHHLDSVRNLLRLQGLNFDKSHNLEKLAQMEDIGIASEFISLFGSAIDWAETQKKYLGEELYFLSKTFPEQIQQEDLRDNFKRAFLLLSAKKQYSPALKALDQEFER